MAINLGAKKEEVLKQGNYLSKTLVPGSGVFTLVGMTCKANDYNDQDGYDITMNLEGEDLTALGFEGFFLDVEDPSLGRHKGAVGKVKLNQYTYVTKTFAETATKAEQTIDRDSAIINDLGKLAKIFNKVDELFEGEVDGIPALIAKAERLFKGCKLAAVIGGKQYIDKKGYTQYELYLVKPDKNFYNMESVDAIPSKLTVFNPSKHIVIKAGKTADTIDTFEPVEAEFAV